MDNEELRAQIEQEVFGGGPRVEDSDDDISADDNQIPAEEEPDEEPVEEPVEEPIPSALKEQLEAISNAIEGISTRIKTTEGRVGAIQSEMAKKASAAAKEVGVDAPTKKQIDDAKKSGEEWAALKDDFPEWANAFDGRFRSYSEELDSKISVFTSKDDVEKLVTETKNSILEDINTRIEYLTVFSRHPDMHEVSGSEDFNVWLIRQGNEMRELANSTKATDVIKVLDTYKGAVKETDGDNRDKKKDRLKKAASPKAVPARKIKSEDNMTEQEYREKLAAQYWNTS